MPGEETTSELISSVTFSNEERNGGILTEARHEEILSLFREFGYVRLNNLFDPEIVADWDRHFKKRYKSYLQDTNRPNRRPLFTVDTEGPFNDPYFYANPIVFPLVKSLLGDDCILGAMSSVVSFPGAPDQFLHRDSKALFGDDFTVDADIPPYAMTMLMPLVDCTLETGCTKVWPKSHLSRTDEDAMKIDSIDPEVRVGSALITNSKLMHRGGANHSNIVRPLLYLTYHRHWFRDFGGYEQRPPVNISRTDLHKVPEEYKHMFTWTKDRYTPDIRFKNWMRRVLPGGFRKLRRN